jgi:hypothetical protein
MRKPVGLGMAYSIPPNLNVDTLFLKKKKLEKQKPRKGKLKNKKE